MDKEKVIKTLTDALTAKENYPWAKAEMSFEFIEMLLALLKEQEVVLCKDCKHGRLYDGNLIDCELNELAKDANFFCADGEAKT